MIDYPEAWGAYDPSHKRFNAIASTEETILWATKDTGHEAVRLIPAPVVERMIAEAEQRGRDAERERCQAAITHWIETVGRFRFEEPEMRDRQIGIIAALKDAVAISSGIEPGKGGE